MQFPSVEPYFSTGQGNAYLGDALVLLKQLPTASIDLICTSPPFALLRQKAYGNVHAKEYVDWFMAFASEFARVLKPKGSLVIDIGGTWVKGFPVRSLYHYELLLKLCQPVSEGGGGYYLAQELYWYNPAKLPTPAEWVTIRRERVKDAVNTVWWFSIDPHPKANNRRVLKPYSESQRRLMKNGYQPKVRPSQHDISDQFGNDNQGAIPPNLINDWEDMLPANVIVAPNTSSNDQYLRLCREAGVQPHPARFPRAVPEFVIGLCTEEDDMVLDPFAGSNMTGYVAETMGRRWIAFEIEESYLRGSIFRFAEESQGDEEREGLVQRSLFDSLSSQE
jgi:site-specific DNA-methyltransferase (cytosine-N4-specific)